MSTVDIHRERKKRTVVNEHLQREITSEITMRPRFGETCYFEYLLTNPYSSEHTFVASFDDEEVRVVTNTQEWKYLRRVNGINSGVEDKLISLRPKDNQAEVFLYPNETVSIPFAFKSMIAGADKGDPVARGIFARSIKVRLTPESPDFSDLP